MLHFCFYAPALSACSGADGGEAGSLGALEQAAQPSTFAYLRCNATGRNVTSTNRFEPTSDPNVLVLDYTVTLPWLARKLEWEVGRAGDGPPITRKDMP